MSRIALLSMALLLAAVLTSVARAQNARGSATGPTTAKGYDDAGQYLQVQDFKPADNMYPVVQHPERDAEARQELEALEKRFGKKPNTLIFLLDDVGLMDRGFNGGGVAVGNSTPEMDKLAFGGLVLSSGALAFNLYTDPQENVSIGVRHIPAAVPVLGAAAFYTKELVKYPPQFKIGFLSNNPPVYDVLPKVREMMENNTENGIGRPTP